MSASLEDLKARHARASRAKAIRSALEWTQPEMAKALNDLARRVGLPDAYDAPKIVKIENAHREIDAFDVVLLAALDPEGRGEHWIVTGLLKFPRLAKAAGDR